MDTLRKLQLLETAMLGQFDSLCRKHDIPYFVIFGTALGAKRHQGFIPWDDDIDIGMLRSDYEKLKRIPEAEWGDLILVDAKSDCFYHEKVFPRVYKPGTVFEAELWKKYTYNRDGIKKPVWIDIFLFDYVDSREEALKKAKKSHKYHILYYYSKYWTNIVSSDSIKRKALSLARNILHVFLSLKKPQSYWDSYYRLVHADSGQFLISFDSWSVKEIMDSLSRYDELFPPKEMPFENIHVMVPNKIELHLERMYGDYMTPPPEGHRVGHLPQTIDLGNDPIIME